MRVTDFIQKEWSANVAIIPLSGSADGRVQQQLELRERSLWEMREGDLRQRERRMRREGTTPF